MATTADIKKNLGEAVPCFELDEAVLETSGSCRRSLYRQSDMEHVEAMPQSAVAGGPLPPLPPLASPLVDP